MEKQALFVCTECGTTCSTKTNMNVHMKRKHKDFIVKLPNNMTVKCGFCYDLFSSTDDMDSHLFSAHDLTVHQEDLVFNSFEKFKEWKLKIEAESQSFYVFSFSKTQADNKKKIVYICHRSGIYQENIKNLKRQRQLKVKGSNKIGYNCPARITIKISSEGEVNVKYISTHCHKVEVGRLRMTKLEREELAGKMLQGIPNYKILKDVGENFDSSSRISYTTNHDLHNIKKSFKIESDMIFDEDDTKSVNILIEKLKNHSDLDNPVLLYKPYGLESDTLGKDNFFLIFMNIAQTEMLSKYGNNIMMIDSTHGTNPYKIQLTTLMVVDDAYEGFPVAFLWSITQTEAIYQTFFSCIKEKVPELKPRIFMSDDSSTFYNAFVKVYDHVPNKILCDWHVKRNLNDNLTKIASTEKRGEVKKYIKLLINELDEMTFTKMMDSLISSLISNEDTKKYGEYFSSYYAKRPEQWAHCFRKGFQKNTNMSLEKWHQELKHNPQMTGKCQRRLDVSINNILECLRMKFLRRLISLSRNRVPSKLSELRKRHKIAEQIAKTVDIVEDSPKQKWFIASSKNAISTSALEYYTIERIKDNAQCQCDFKCNECKCCLHTYSCTCHDYAIQYNMCKHIHMVCSRYPPDFQENICLDQENEDNVLYIDEDDNNNRDYEHEFISKQLSQNSGNSIELEKKSSLEKLNILIGLITNSNDLEEISYASKNFSAIISGISAIRTTKSETMIAINNYPHNKKSEFQNRRVSISLKALRRKRKRT